MGSGLVWELSARSVVLWLLLRLRTGLCGWLSGLSVGWTCYLASMTWCATGYFSGVHSLGSGWWDWALASGWMIVYLGLGFCCGWIVMDLG